MGSTTCTASKVKRLAAQKPLVNHQSFSLDKLSSKPDRSSGNCFGLSSFCLVWFVCLGGSFIPPPPLILFPIKDWGPSVCFYSCVAFPLLCLLSIKWDKLYFSTQRGLLGGLQTSLHLSVILSTQVYKILKQCRFLRHICVSIIPSLSNLCSVQITGGKNGSKHIHPPSTLRKAVFQLRAKNEEERHWNT